MIKKIHELRQKSHPEKERIAFIGATIITFFIVLFWIAGVTSLSKVDKNQKAEASEPFNGLVESLSGIFKK